MGKLKKQIILFCLILSTNVVAEIPHLGSASDALWSQSAELSIGKAAYDRLRHNGQLHEYAADLDYLNYLGNKIASFAETRLGLTFYLTRSQSINAFASPGGYVGVNAGLILATENEHELAAVLGHEIAHVAQEHIARTLLAAKNRQIANTAALVAGILMAKADSQLAAASISAVLAGETQQQINDIRRHEIEADNIGRQLMTKAGFNELGMQTFFGKLYTPSSMNHAPAYLLTHPLPQRRQAALDKLKKRSASLVSRDEYYLFRARIQAAFLSNDALQREISDAQQSNHVQRRDVGYYLSTLLAMKQGQLADALHTLNQLSTTMRDNRDVLLLKAKLHILQDGSNTATSIYQRLWKRYPGDSVIAYDYGQFLNQQKQFRQAEAILSAAIDSSNDPQIYWLYGQVLEKVGKRIEQHRMLIRYYRQNGEYEQALIQAKIAANRSDLDWQDRASFEAQQQELQQIIDKLETFSPHRNNK